MSVFLRLSSTHRWYTRRQHGPWCPWWRYLFNNVKVPPWVKGSHWLNARNAGLKKSGWNHVFSDPFSLAIPILPDMLWCLFYAFPFAPWFTSNRNLPLARWNGCPMVPRYAFNAYALAPTHRKLVKLVAWQRSDGLPSLSLKLVWPIPQQRNPWFFNIFSWIAPGRLRIPSLKVKELSSAPRWHAPWNGAGDTDGAACLKRNDLPSGNLT
jgi:hypothetical protein